MEEIQGVYVISVAARLLDMHPQTLRKYERVGLIAPYRTVGIRRLYSYEDIARLRIIKHLVDELGLNLAGTELALGLANKLLQLRGEVQNERNPRALRQRVLDSIKDMLESLGLTEEGTAPENS